MSALSNVTEVAILQTPAGAAGPLLAGWMSEREGPFGTRLQTWRLVTNPAASPRATRFIPDLTIETEFVEAMSGHRDTLNLIVAAGGIAPATHSVSLDTTGPIPQMSGESLPAAWIRAAKGIAHLVGSSYFVTGRRLAAGEVEPEELQTDQISANFKGDPGNLAEPWLKVEPFVMTYPSGATQNLKWEVWSVPGVDLALNRTLRLRKQAQPADMNFLGGNGPFTLIVSGG